MAAVLASLLPSGWQSTERIQRQTKEAEPKAMQPRIVPPMPTVPGATRLDDPAFEAGTSEEEERSQSEDKDAEGDVDEEYAGSARSAQEEVENSLKRKRNNQRVFQKNARIRATPSEEDATEEGSESSSEVDQDWEAESEKTGSEGPGNADVSKCLFCDQDENNDPSEDFEELLTCMSCGEKAHRQCAREANSFSSEEDAECWRCSTCIDRGSEAEHESPNTRLRSSSAPKIARDLLPAQRGSAKPGSHSVFNNLILSDDPMDGSRSLRKRKASSESQDRPVLELRKSNRHGTSTDTLPLMSALDGQTEADNALVSGPVDMNSPRTRGARRAGRKSERILVSVVEPRVEDKLTLIIRLPSEKLGSLDHERRKKRKRENERRRRERLQRPAIPEPEVQHFPGLPHHTLREQYLFSDSSGDDKPKPKQYGGILNEAEADTSRSFPQPPDMRKFEDARKKAEEQWKQKIQAAAAAEASRPAQKQATSASKIKCINFGGYEIDTWHAAPYPEEYTRNRVLYICEYCLKYMNSDFVAWRHKLKCPAKHPPGDEIYRDGSFSFFEVDGRKNPVYCQNLCLLAKLFLGSKTLYYDVDPFLFYVMTENDEFGCHFVGYFSKEKRPSSQNNVSCILVLPIHQRRGFGNFLIDFSYLLSRVEGKTGSPEKPLSDMGLVTYRSYWRLIMCYQLVDQDGTLSISDLSDRTGMTADDVVCALEGLRALVRDPVTTTYALRLDYAYMRKYIADYETKGYAKLDETSLMWVPYVMGRDNQHYETAAPLRTVAQRDDTDDAEPEEGVQQEAAGVSTEAGVLSADSASKQASTPGEQEPSTPFPALHSQESNTSLTVAKVTPTTPFVHIERPDDEIGATIPATRFEIFPPVPGAGPRRRMGRPPKRPSTLRNSSTQVGPGSDMALPSAPGTARPTTLRRGRSKIGEGTAQLDGVENTDDRLGDDIQSPSHGRGDPEYERGQKDDMDVEEA